MSTKHTTRESEPTIDDVVRTHFEVSSERMAARKPISVQHEGRPIKINVRVRRLLGAAGVGIAALTVFNVLSNDSNGEEEVYKGPLHVVTADDGTRIVEGVYDVKKGDTIWDVAAQVNELGGVKGGDAESQLLKTLDYLALTGGGMREDGSTIPIQGPSQLAPGQDILVHDFKVNPEGKSQISINN